MATSPRAPAPYRTGTGRTVLLAGASGLVGRELLGQLLADPSVAQVHALVRRDLPQPDPRLVQHLVDFRCLPTLPGVAEAYVALGTTIKVAGSQEAFRAVDFDAVLAVARAAKSAGATRLGVVSAMGAHAGSRVFYNRVKGEMEQALRSLGFGTLVIARPSLLVGDRHAAGQPVRRGEAIGQQASRWIGFLIPANYRPIEARKVAAALLRAVPRSTGQHVLLSGDMQQR
ncbi:MAG TPA: NAD(P)H-binding protein [Ramlibacter sp.]|nr:NAD(P)H-binding protein [Ramlibacter sp.]